MTVDKNPDALKVTELRTELENLNQPVEGNKEELVSRLEEAIAEAEEPKRGIRGDEPEYIAPYVADDSK